jgi:hypothetical protein
MTAIRDEGAQKILTFSVGTSSVFQLQILLYYRFSMRTQDTAHSNDHTKLF